MGMGILKLNSLLSRNITVSSIREFAHKAATMQKAPRLKMNNCLEMPALGLGTWQAEPGEVATAVKTAIKAGYRHIDCAMLYDNEKEIGDGICQMMEEGVVKREELFIVTKLWNTFHEREVVVDTCRKSLANFGLGYVDLYLIHWPVAMKRTEKFNVKFPFADAEGLDYDYVDTWKGMEECVKLGLTKSIGVSNFNKGQIDRLLQNCNIKPVTNQIEVNLFNNQEKMIAYCKQRDMIVTAYSPFSSPARQWKKEGEPSIDWKDEKLMAIAKNHCKTVGQVLLRHLIQIGVVPIPKSTNPTRIPQNLDVFDFELTPQEMCVINGYNVDFRAVPGEEMKDLPHYPFHNWI